MSVTNNAELADREPDGIDVSVGKQGFTYRHATPISVILLGGLFCFGLAGFAGGGSPAVKSAQWAPAKLSVQYADILRNGELFELWVSVEARKDLQNATLAVEPALWRHMTINSMLPAASEEAYGQGGFRFSYGALKTGEKLVIKIDGQINPPLLAGTAGNVSLYDNDIPIGDLALSIKVWP